MKDHELIEQYRNGSADAFSAIVRRHVDWVYSAARRRVRDAHLAEDVTQAVFITLSRKMPRLQYGSLSPWLFAVLIRISRDAIKRQAIRHRHESEAAKMRQSRTSDPQADWDTIAPNLEEAVARLRFADQQAILLRFYEQLSFAEVRAMLGITEEAARKRVSRATEKLRGVLKPDGANVSATSLSTILLAEVATPTPATVLAHLSTHSWATVGAGANGAKGWIAIMAYAKTKACIAAAVVLILLTVAGLGISTRRKSSSATIPPTPLAASSNASANTPEADELIMDIAAKNDEALKSLDRGSYSVEWRTESSAANSAPNTILRTATVVRNAAQYYSVVTKPVAHFLKDDPAKAPEIRQETVRAYIGRSSSGVYIVGGPLGYLYDHASIDHMSGAAQEVVTSELLFDAVKYAFGNGRWTLLETYKATKDRSKWEIQSTRVPDGGDEYLVKAYRSASGQLRFEAVIRPDQGFLMTRFTTYDTEGNLTLNQVVVPAKDDETGKWFPSRMDQVEYHTTGSAGGVTTTKTGAPGDVRSRSTIAISKVTFDKPVPDSAFSLAALELPEGTRVIHQKTDGSKSIEVVMDGKLMSGDVAGVAQPSNRESSPSPDTRAR